MTIDRAAADELLSTTRAVRKRLDLTRPVPMSVILDCIRLSQQAPTASNRQNWRWVVVTDPGRRRALADLYRGIWAGYVTQATEGNAAPDEAQTTRVYDSATHLANHMQDVPALVVPCVLGRPPEGAGVRAAALFASIYPAVWSFSLALRARGLGTALTTIHLQREAEAARILGIPGDVTQAALLPVAYTIGDSFRPADRPPPESITFVDQWGAHAR